MSQREKRLGIAFITVAMLILAGRYAKPVFIDPLFNTEQVRIAQRELDAVIEDHDKLEAQLSEKYAGYIQRTKTTKPDDARDDLYDCISGLVRDAKLRQPVITPKEPRPIDKRSKVVTIQISMSAIGSFRQSVDFVRRFYRIPYIARFNSLKLEPTSARQRQRHDEVKLTGEIEVLVLPDEELLDFKVGKQPDYILKYAMKNITKLKSWKPFTPYEKPAPPTPPPPGPEKDKKHTPPPPPPPTGPPHWDDASEWMLKMVMRYGVDEIRLSNIVDESTIHVALGEEFDGGTLVLVSALGVVSFKEDYGYYVYPLGQYVSDAIALQDADDWPEIQVAMLQYFDAEDRRNAIEDAERKAQDAKRQAMVIPEPVDDAFVGPPDETANDIPHATSNGVVSAKSLMKQMGIDRNNPDVGSNGVDSNGAAAADKRFEAVPPDATTSGIRKETKTQMQPPLPEGVKSKAGSNGSEDTKGRRGMPRSFRSRSNPNSKTATPDESNSAKRGEVDQEQARPSKTDPQK
ncbi:MAG: hypothetical protein DHS20C16_18030 [Phycisphaerae bacterium]|nr:MAG: hypothetical protein DHS20C16_18030 [Phycisphaerae bacterium]